MTVAFEPRRFRSTVPYYARYRVSYPDRLIRFVADRCEIDEGAPVLDLGCGPAPLAVGFARFGATVTAMDPEPDMLDAARERARESNVTLRTIEGSSYDLGTVLGRFRLVTMGRSFHWMDRPATLSALDRLIEPGGAVALFDDRRIPSPGVHWRTLVEQLHDRFMPDQTARRRQRKLEEERHEAVLLRSAFSDLERYGVVFTRKLDPDEIVGWVFSTSITSPEALGDKKADFESALREGLAAMSTSGEFSEIVEVNALIAKRPKDT
ncbi:MAG TPA: class I SAM-dependent methyltransferase [Stellaceae bacterium]|nr:class I SAM-dependent methyltransferase [Stellaceae bacterium]